MGMGRARKAGMVNQAESPGKPEIKPVEPKRIPEAIKVINQWFPWRAGRTKINGKFDKIPTHPVSGKNIDPLDPLNWFSFDEAMQAYRNGVGDGVGIALSDNHPILVSGETFHLVAIDLDNCAGRIADCQDLWLKLGQPYVEASPSGKGLRMLGLSRTLVTGGNAGDGRELYANKRFVTVTGNGGVGEIVDFTDGIVDLEFNWFGNSAAAKLLPKQGQPVQTTMPEKPGFVEPVLSMLEAVSSDTDYQTWRNIVYSIASTGWTSARQIAHQWSAKAQHRYDATAVDKLFDSFDPTRGITIGTLHHHARSAGWLGTLPPTSHTQLSTPQLLQSQTSLLLTADQLRHSPRVPYVVRKLLPAEGLAAIYGEPGAGKSFLALHLAHSVATGAGDWFGFRVRQTPVIYIALEGVGGIGKRTYAIELHSNQTCSDKLRFWCHDINLLTGDSVDLLAEKITAELGQGVVVIIDTLNQASPGGDENTSQDMGRIIANSKRLGASVGGLVILVHHSGKNRAQGLRGHSSLHAAMDVVIEVSTVNSKHKAWSVTKAKDDSSDVKRDFDLIPYIVDQDEDGDPITSCAVQPTIHAPTLSRKKPSGKNQRTALAATQGYLQQPGANASYKTILAVVASELEDSNRKTERAKEAVDALIRHGHLVLNERGISLV